MASKQAEWQETGSGESNSIHELHKRHKAQGKELSYSWSDWMLSRVQMKCNVTPLTCEQCQMCTNDDGHLEREKCKKSAVACALIV